MVSNVFEHADQFNISSLDRRRGLVCPIAFASLRQMAGHDCAVGRLSDTALPGLSDQCADRFYFSIQQPLRPALLRDHADRSRTDGLRGRSRILANYSNALNRFLFIQYFFCYVTCQ